MPIMKVEYPEGSGNYHELDAKDSQTLGGQLPSYYAEASKSSKRAITLNAGSQTITASKKSLLKVGRIDGATEVTVDRGVLFVSSPYVKNDTNDTYQYFGRDSKGKVLKLANGEYLENGKKYKLWETDVAVLDTMQDLSSATLSGYTTGKRLQFTLNLATTSPDVYVTKYDGTNVPKRPTSTHEDDTWIYDDTIPRFFIYVNNYDTGWGDGYSPTIDEVKAYLLGWKMYDGSTGATMEEPYSRTDGVNKRWTHRLEDGTLSGTNSGTGTTPPWYEAPLRGISWDYYKLHYKIPTPYFEDIQTEGQMILEEGSNSVTLGSGVIVREKMRLSKGTTTTLTNATNTTPDTVFEHKTDTILDVFRNGESESLVAFNTGDESGWRVVDHATYGNAYGNERLNVQNIHVNFNEHYSVTYLALANEITTTLSSVSAEVYENIKSNIDVAMEKIAELAKQGGSMGHYLTSLLAMGGEVQIMETATGTALRWDTGTQICFHIEGTSVYADTAYGSIYFGTKTLYFPAEFHGSPIVAPAVMRVGGVAWGGLRYRTSQYAELYVFGGASSDRGYAGYIAIGRWK